MDLNSQLVIKFNDAVIDKGPGGKRGDRTSPCFKDGVGNGGTDKYRVITSAVNERPCVNAKSEIL